MTGGVVTVAGAPWRLRGRRVTCSGRRRFAWERVCGRGELGEAVWSEW